jgi:hypothetical protein
MRIFLTKAVARFVCREAIPEEALLEAIKRAERGIVDADLGDGLLKQRVARRSKGRSGGYRMRIGYRRGDRAVFVFGFAKNDRPNIDHSELILTRGVAKVWLNCNETAIHTALQNGQLTEVPCGSKKITVN